MPQILSLKVGAPVILRRTISPALVNGLQGTVQSIDHSGPTVLFQNGMLIKMEKITFYLYDQQGKVYSSRTQFPITLAYALTVHKAQGLTIAKHLIIDCCGMNQPGQFAVALGRAIDMKKVSLLNLEKCEISHHPDYIISQYKGWFASFLRLMEGYKSHHVSCAHNSVIVYSKLVF